MSLFINFKPQTQTHFTGTKRKHDETSRPGSPSKEADLQRGKSSSTLNGDTFFSPFKHSESTDHIDLITKAIGEEGGDTQHRDLVAQLEELYSREEEQERPNPTDPITKAIGEEGGFISSTRDRANLFGPATSKPQAVSLDMDFLNETLENKKAKQEPARSSAPKKQTSKNGPANRFSPFGPFR